MKKVEKKNSSRSICTHSIRRWFFIFRARSVCSVRSIRLTHSLVAFMWVLPIVCFVHGSRSKAHVCVTTTATRTTSAAASAATVAATSEMETQSSGRHKYSEKCERATVVCGDVRILLGSRNSSRIGKTIGWIQRINESCVRECDEHRIVQCGSVLVSYS